MRPIPQLDGVRGLAVLLVILAHAGSMGFIGDSTGNGQVGVMLFFVLSGFLLTSIYANQPMEVNDLKAYYLRRFFRVYPVYFLVLLLSWKTPLPGYAINNTNIIGHLLLQDGISILWTIPVELKYYAVFPLLAAALLMIRSGVTRLVVLLCLVLLTSGMSNEGLRTQLLPYLGFFLSGSVVSILYARVAKNFLQNMSVDILFILALGLFVFSLPSTTRFLFEIDPPLWEAPISYMMIIGLLLFTAVQSQRISMFVFGNQVMRFLGKISFSLYLVHLPIMNSIATLELDPWVVFPMMILSAYFTWRVVEHPCQNLGRFLAESVRSDSQTKSSR